MVLPRSFWGRLLVGLGLVVACVGTWMALAEIQHVRELVRRYDQVADRQASLSSLLSALKEAKEALRLGQDELRDRMEFLSSVAAALKGAGSALPVAQEDSGMAAPFTPPPERRAP
jgi:hypothetical protein